MPHNSNVRSGHRAATVSSHGTGADRADEDVTVNTPGSATSSASRLDPSASSATPPYPAARPALASRRSDYPAVSVLNSLTVWVLTPAQQQAVVEVARAYLRGCNVQTTPARLARLDTLDRGEEGGWDEKTLGRHGQRGILLPALTMFLLSRI